MIICVVVDDPLRQWLQGVGERRDGRSEPVMWVTLKAGGGERTIGNRDGIEERICWSRVQKGRKGKKKSEKRRVEVGMSRLRHIGNGRRTRERRRKKRHGAMLSSPG